MKQAGRVAGEKRGRACDYCMTTAATRCQGGLANCRTRGGRQLTSLIAAGVSAMPMPLGGHVCPIEGRAGRRVVRGRACLATLDSGPLDVTSAADRSVGYGDAAVAFCG